MDRRKHTGGRAVAPSGRAPRDDQGGDGIGTEGEFGRVSWQHTGEQAARDPGSIKGSNAPQEPGGPCMRSARSIRRTRACWRGPVHTVTERVTLSGVYPVWGKSYDAG